ncbi:MAG: alpha amylase C-terminal domain-containing protein, partial [Pseudomonadota bacterium]
WGLLARPEHRGVQQLARDLNRLYRGVSALHELDFDHQGFSWIDCHDADQSVISFLRRDRSGACAIIVLNFTPVPRRAYRIGVPAAGRYREIFNSDSRYYGGSDVGNSEGLEAVSGAWMDQPAQLELMLPPLAGLILIRADA